jgi:hypothetical protein
MTDAIPASPFSHLRLRARDLPNPADFTADYPGLTLSGNHWCGFDVTADGPVFGGRALTLWSGYAGATVAEELRAEVAAFNTDPRTGWLQLLLEAAERLETRAGDKAQKWEERARRGTQLANLAHALQKVRGE